MMASRLPALLLTATLTMLMVGCDGRTVPPPKTYQLEGQILSLTPDKKQVAIKHKDIKGFMPAMTMTYTVEDAALLKGKEPGDLVTATLVVGEVDAHLSSLTKTGHAAVEAPPPVLPDFLEPHDAVASAPLVDQAGAPRSIASFAGHRVALTFIYTRCPLPNFCPLMDRNFAEIQKKIQSTPSLSDVRLISVTVDPVFDTPAVLAAHAKALGADPRVWSFLTGAPDDVARFSAPFGIHFEGDPDNPDVVIHNLRTAVIDREGRLVKIESDNTWTPAQLIADLETASAPAN